MEIKRPFDLLNQCLENNVLVKLKEDREIRGILKAFDQHMNLVLDNAEEWENGEMKVKIGKVIVRGDNILYVAP